MEQEDKYAELIEKHFDGSLTDVEEQEVQRLLAENKKFQEAFVFHKQLLDAVDVAKEKELKEFLSEIETQLNSDRPKAKSISLNVWYSLAASLVLLILASWFFFNSDVAPSELYAQNFKPYRNVLHPVTRGDSPKSKLDIAFNAYEKRDFAKAIEGFQEILADSSSAAINFYLGVSYLANNQTDKAIDILKATSQQPGQFQPDASWYLALAHLKNEKPEIAKASLEKLLVSKANDKLKEKARQILKEL